MIYVNHQADKSVLENTAGKYAALMSSYQIKIATSNDDEKSGYESLILEAYSFVRALKRKILSVQNQILLQFE